MPRSTYYDLALTNDTAFAGSEFGNSSGGKSCATDYDFRDLIDQIRTNTPRTSHLMVWLESWRIGNPSHHHQPDLMNDSWVVARSEVTF